MSSMPIPGLDRAWDALAPLEKEAVCRASGASLEPATGAYRMKCLNSAFLIDPARRAVLGADAEAEALRARFSDFVHLLTVWYLVGAKDIGLSGRLTKPEQLRGGHHFFTGTHALPLDKVAARYGSDREGFIAKGLALGGREVKYGDAAIELLPAPRIPVTMILWLGDEEFPSRADLLMDTSADFHAQLDILWCAMMLCPLAML